MKAAIFHGPGKPISIDTVAMPQPGPDDVLIKIARCGICGSDISMTGDNPFTFQPGPIGHEYAGEIIEVSRNVSAIKRGQRVACLPGTPCGQCDGCRRTGNGVFCTNPRRAQNGTTGFGGFGEYIAIPAGGAVVLPDSLSVADGALIEPMACGLHALRMAAMAKDALVLVLGAGSMALSTIFWARRLGAGRIVVASRSRRRADVALAMGADVFHSFADDDPAVLLPLLGRAPDIVVECTGKQGMLGDAIGHIRPGGTVISLGMCQHSEPVVPALCAFKEARLLFPVAYTVAEFIETARAFDVSGIHPDIMVSDVIGLDELPAAIEDLRSGRRQGLKIHVDPELRVNVLHK